MCQSQQETKYCSNTCTCQTKRQSTERCALAVMVGHMETDRSLFRGVLDNSYGFATALLVALQEAQIQLDIMMYPELLYRPRALPGAGRLLEAQSNCRKKLDSIYDGATEFLKYIQREQGLVGLPTKADYQCQSARLMGQDLG